MEMFNVNIFLSSALFVRGAVRLFLFTGQLSKEKIPGIYKEVHIRELSLTDGDV